MSRAGTAAAGRLKLNIGSGRRREPGFLSVDNNPNAAGADIVHDLDALPWPFADGSVSDVLMDHSLEHLEDTIRTLQELYRICADGAVLWIRTPHLSCAWSHPGHKRAIGVGLFDHFDPAHEEHYGDCRFVVERLRLRWLRPRAQTSWVRRLAAAPIDWLANANPRLCQRLWCYWVGGFEELEFQVRVVKPSARKESNGA